MKKSVVVLLLVLLAVVTIFTATSCKGKAVLGSSGNISNGIDIPPGEDLYLDAGFGWKSTQEVSWMDIPRSFVGPPLEDPAFLATGEDFQSLIVTVPLRGSRIRIASRLSTSEKEFTSDIAKAVGIVALYPLSSQERHNVIYVCTGGCYVCLSANMITSISADKSDYDAGYTYVEIDNIPSSPTGYYAFDYAGGKRIFLQRQD